MRPYVVDEHLWRLLWAYHADGGSGDPEWRRHVARDDDGRPNVYNTLLLIIQELFPQRYRKLMDSMEASGR